MSPPWMEHTQKAAAALEGLLPWADVSDLKVSLVPADATHLLVTIMWRLRGLHDGLCAAIAEHGPKRSLVTLSHKTLRAASVCAEAIRSIAVPTRVMSIPAWDLTQPRKTRRKRAAR